LRGKEVALWGLAFKANTDDMRSAPSIDIIAHLQAEGCHVRAHDPIAMEKAKPLFKGVQYCRTPYEAAKGADAVVLVTEWPDYKQIDLKKVKAIVQTPVFIDGRNLYNPKTVADLGFDYHSVGRAAPKVNP
jgi:UDPglucose 6-dehydrogenase